MKTIIAGSRTITNRNEIAVAVARSRFQISEVVSGGARGIDQLGERWAETNEIPIKQFLPRYETFGKKAPIIRNAEMARYADALIAIWDGKSGGTRNMIEQAKKYGLRLYVVTK
jgi:hypothetical protein